MMSRGGDGSGRVELMDGGYSCRWTWMDGRKGGYVFSCHDEQTSSYHEERE